MERYWKEVMLDKIAITEGQNDVKLSFYDSTTGEDIVKLICNHVVNFNYSSSFQKFELGDEFPCFVLDVSIKKIKQGLEEILIKNRFAFSQQGTPAIPQFDSYYLLKVEGGPVYVEIIANKIEISNLKEE